LGYFIFFCAAILVISLKTLKSKIITVGMIYAVPILMNIAALVFWGWKY